MINLRSLMPLHSSERWSPGAGKPGYVPVLDGWRAVAIFLVVMFHASLNTDFAGHDSLKKISSILGSFGSLGVLIFFTISGYLITGRLVATQRETGKFFLGEFYFKRAFRILPLAYLYLFLIFVSALFHFITLVPGDRWAWVFLTNYHSNQSWYTAHFWSLSIEEHFYLFWPVMLALLGWRKAIWAGIAIVIAEAFWRPWLLHRTLNMVHALRRTDMRIDFLLIGGIVAIATFEWPAFRPWLEKLGSPLNALLLMVLLGVSLAPWSFDTRSIQALLLAGLVCGTSNSHSPVIKYLLANRFVLWLGQISYSIYILQEPFLAHFETPWLNTPIAAVCKILFVLGIAHLSYKYVEQPFIRFARQYIKASKAAKTQAVAAVD